MDGLKYPPAGVEHLPTSDDILPIRDAAKLLGMDHRTVRKAIVQGRIRGGARPHPSRLKWYVYADQTPTAQRPAQPTSDSIPNASEVADLKAQIVTLKETNRLLNTANALSLAALNDYKEAADGFRNAAEGMRAALDGALGAADGFRNASIKYQSAAEGFQAALLVHKDIVTQYTTPGHAGSLTDP